MFFSKEYLTSKELAIFLNCSNSLIRKLKRERRIPFIKIGSSIRFSKAEVLKALKENSEDGYYF